MAENKDKKQLQISHPTMSAFETVTLAKAYAQMWELGPGGDNENPARFATRVNFFVRVMPSILRDKIPAKYPDFERDLETLEKKLKALDEVKTHGDAFDAEAIDNVVKPSEELEFAIDVWSAVIDVLTDSGFNFPVRRGTGDYNVMELMGDSNGRTDDSR